MLRDRPADSGGMALATRMLLVSALILALSGVAGAPGPASARVAEAKQHDARPQPLFGMNAPSLAPLDEIESAVGARAAIIGTYADWALEPDFPPDSPTASPRGGAVPLVSWEPWDSWRGGVDQPAYALRRIVAGDHDALIERWAAQIGRYRRPVMLRFAAGDERRLAALGDRRQRQPARRVRRRLAARRRALPARRRPQRRLGVEPERRLRRRDPVRRVLPGRTRGRLGGLDGYNWGAARQGWQTFADVFASDRRDRELAPRRP